MSRPQRKKRRRYTRRQIMINRLIVLAAAILLLVLLFSGARWALVKLNILGSPSVFESEIEPKGEREAAPESPEEPEPSQKVEKDSSAQQGYQGIDLGMMEPASTSREKEEPYYEGELPMLAGPDNPIPEDYSLDLVNIGGDYQFDRHASEALKAMLAAAAQDNVNLYVISAYRSFESQSRLFTNKVQEYKNYGHDAETAAVYAARWVARPGTSEHGTGLAVDLNSLEESFENTAEFAWLQEHCADYGFILRYRKDKVDITKINYEPWHYRYVGSNHAKKIMEKGISLEEYLEAFYQEA